MNLEEIIKNDKKKLIKKVESSITTIKNYINQIYSLGNVNEIMQVEDKIEDYCKYIKKEFGIYLPTQKEREERLKDDEKRYLEVLKKYQLNDLIEKVKLSEETGIAIKNLSARTRGDKPYIENTSTEHYKLIRPITKEQADQANERFIGISDNVLNDHKNYLDEKVTSDKPHI